MTQYDDAAVATLDDDETEPAFDYPVTVEDAGPAAKKVTVEIPEARIREVREHSMADIMEYAALPGFRPGKAPRKLVEKRFGKELQKNVRDQLLRESYQQAVRKNDLAVLGEPDFGRQTLDLPETGALSYTFEVEVQPTFEVPDLADLVVRKPKIEVGHEHVQQALKNLREQQGALVPAERPIVANDYVVADVVVRAGGEEIARTTDAQVVARPGVVVGLQIDDLDKQLEGASAGETRVVRHKAPDTHPNERLRGRDVELEFEVKDVKALELAELDEPFLESLGFANQDELMDELRKQMVERVDADVKAAQHNQLRRAIVERVKIDLPAKLSSQQEQRVVQRRAGELLNRGVPREQVGANLGALRQGAGDEAVRELKLLFVLDKLAQQHDITVDDEEVNGRIAYLAAQFDARPEKVKADMAARGELANLYVSMRESKVLDEVLKSVKVEEIDPKQFEAEQKAKAEAEAPAEASEDAPASDEKAPATDAT